MKRMHDQTQLRVSHVCQKMRTTCASHTQQASHSCTARHKLGFCRCQSPEQTRPFVFCNLPFTPFVTRQRRSQACLLFPSSISAFRDLYFVSLPRAVMLVQSPGPRVQESECWPVTNAKPHVVRRVSRSGSLRPVSTAQKVPPKKEPQESRRDRLERAITSFRTPARAAAQKVSSDLPCHSHPLSRSAEVLNTSILTALFLLQLQQKASEVDSSRVSGAIQNLINSWKASDSQADQDAATTSSQAPQNEGDSAGKAGPNSSSLNPPEQSGNAQPAEDEKQQEKSNRLLSLFSRGKNGQQQPEEMMPVRVSPSCGCYAFALTKAATNFRTGPADQACRLYWPCTLLPDASCTLPSLTYSKAAASSEG